MIKIKDETHRNLVQKNLFQTIARNLILQFRRNGFDDRQLIGFCNNVMEAILKEKSPDITCRAKTINVSDNTEEYEETLPVDLDPTNGIILRELYRSDYAAMTTWQNDNAILNSLAGFSLRRIVKQNKNLGKHKLFSIVDQTANRIVGVIGLLDICSESSQGELIKMIGMPEYRGKGYARKAASFVLKYAFDDLNLNRVFLRTIDGNLKNIALNQSLGFSFEGVLRSSVKLNSNVKDVIIMGLLREDRKTKGLT